MARIPEIKVFSHRTLERFLLTTSPFLNPLHRISLNSLRLLGTIKIIFKQHHCFYSRFRALIFWFTCNFHHWDSYKLFFHVGWKLIYVFNHLFITSSLIDKLMSWPAIFALKRNIAASIWQEMQHQNVLGLERYECNQWVDTVYRGLCFTLSSMDMNIPIYFL